MVRPPAVAATVLVGRVAAEPEQAVFGALFHGGTSSQFTIEGRIERLAYLSLYQKHLLALHALRWVTLAARLAHFGADRWCTGLLYGMLARHR
jgi:hypothetical protein